MIMVINGRPYEMVDLHSFARKLSFNHLMGFNRELATTNISSCRTINDVLAVLNEVKDLPVGDLEGNPGDTIVDHPEGMFLLGVMIWAARTAAGERLTLLEACDFDLGALEFVREPDAAEADPVGESRASGRGGANAGVPRDRKPSSRTSRT